MKQPRSKLSVTKWLTIAQRYEIGKKGAEIRVTLAISQPLQPSSLVEECFKVN